MFTFEDGAAPEPLTGAERQRNYRAAGKELAPKKRYRHDNSKYESNAAYLSRPFRAWDGEGVTVGDGSHLYTMLASKLDGEASTDIIAANGLRTAEIFDYVIDTAADDNAINVIYGGGYDFNMWLGDFTEEELRSVYTDKSFTWNGYRIMWRRGKSLFLARIGEDGKSVGKGVTIYDVVSFFQCPFVRACDDYLGDRFAHRDVIVANKALRGEFSNVPLETVRQYNDYELENLLRLVKELRERLNKVGLRPKRWDGPGAVAAALLQRESIKDHMCETPEPVAEAARYAYAGGRFEVIKFGHVEQPAFEYDVNSAYPAALRNVPSLTQGKWVHSKGEPKTPGEFALYHIKYRGKNPRIPGALFRRDENGTICYPMKVTGWYWSPEYAVAKEYCARGNGTMEVLEAWTFVPNKNAPKPFAFIEPLYNKRRALKKAKDGAHVGLKLALNSLYGKLAQQVGAEFRRGEWRKPPFHQIEWAGYTTSFCRARVLTAVLDNLHDVIAFETDAVFTAVELSVPLTSELGDFEEVRFGDLTYVQSGLYFGESDSNISKTRGVDRGILRRNDVLEKMKRANAEERTARVSITRFTGAGIALAQSFTKWRRWETMEKNLMLEPSGKRIHLGCSEDAAPGIILGVWHTTRCPMMNDAHSCEYPVAWINPNPRMTELEERREMEKNYE